MRHLWHGAVKGWALGSTTRGIALCNKSFPRDELRVVISGVDCPVCLERYGRVPKAPMEPPVLDAFLRVDLYTLKMRELLAVRNKLADELGRSPVDRFRSRKDGIHEAQKLQKEVKERRQ